MSLMLVAVLVSILLSSGIASAGEAQAEIDSYQRVRSDREWRDYQRWKRNQEDAYLRDTRDHRPVRGNCKGWVVVEGQKMWGGILARREARKSWERAARSRYPADHADWDYAGAKRNGGFRCWHEGTFTRCEARAMACRAS